LVTHCRNGVVAHLAAVSRDFAESLEEDPSAGDLRVAVHAFGTGPFAGGDSTIKNVYLVRTTEA
jgi:phenylacetate-CoA ligase